LSRRGLVARMSIWCLPAGAEMPRSRWFSLPLAFTASHSSIRLASHQHLPHTVQLMVAYPEEPLVRIYTYTSHLVHAQRDTAPTREHIAAVRALAQTCSDRRLETAKLLHRQSVQGCTRWFPSCLPRAQCTTRRLPGASSGTAHLGWVPNATESTYMSCGVRQSASEIILLASPKPTGDTGWCIHHLLVDAVAVQARLHPTA